LLGAELEACEAGELAVAMEVDLATVGGRNDAAVALGIDRGYALLLMSLAALMTQQSTDGSKTGD